MLQLQYIKEHTEEIIERLKIKNVQNVEERIAEIISLDEQRRALQQKADAVKAEQNSIAKQIGILFKQGKRDEAETLKARTADLKAQEKELSEQMLASVVDIAKLYSGQGVSIEELIGAGNEALVTGVKLLGHLDSPQEVDGELGRRVMDSMEDLISAMLDDHAMDRQMEDMVNLVADKARELAEELGRKVTPMELAGEGDVSAEQIAEAVRLTGGRIEDLE